MNPVNFIRFGHGSPDPAPWKVSGHQKERFKRLQAAHVLPKNMTCDEWVRSGMPPNSAKARRSVRK